MDTDPTTHHLQRARLAVRAAKILRLVGIVAVAIGVPAALIAEAREPDEWRRALWRLPFYFGAVCHLGAELFLHRHHRPFVVFCILAIIVVFAGLLYGLARAW